MFLIRTLGACIAKVNDFFPVVLITGPRQVGKTSLLEECAKENRKYVSLDSFEKRSLAQNDPALFLQKYKPPVLIDEIQYAPQLFPYIKEIADREKQKGLFWITGSQQFTMSGRMRRVRSKVSSISGMSSKAMRLPSISMQYRWALAAMTAGVRVRTQSSCREQEYTSSRSS